MLLDSKTDETEMDFWQRQNKNDNAIGLYCQSCCYRYPSDCESIGTLHPFDRAAETCPDFIPKDYYKAKSRAKCWKKRLENDPDYEPLPQGRLNHPINWWCWLDSKQYYKMVTKIKVFNFLKVFEK